MKSSPASISRDLVVLLLKGDFHFGFTTEVCGMSLHYKGVRKTVLGS